MFKYRLFIILYTQSSVRCLRKVYYSNNITETHFINCHYYYFFHPVYIAIVNEDYLEFEMNITFISGQNSTGDNEQCFYVVLLDDNVLEGNETFDILIRPSPEDEDIVNITGGIITVTIEEDPTDSKHRLNFAVSC